MGRETIEIDGSEFEVISDTNGAIVAQKGLLTVITSPAMVMSEGRSYVDVTPDSTKVGVIEGLFNAKD